MSWSRGVLRLVLVATSLALCGCIGARSESGPAGGGGGGGSSILTVAPATASLASGGTQTFSCSESGAAATCTWAVREGSAGGSINGSGVYSAPVTGGTYHVQATSGTATAEATVSVTGPAATVSVSPGAVYLAPGSSITFSATVNGPSDKSVTWSVAEGASGGSVTSGGVYTAPSAAGTYNVVATSVANPAKSGSAAVTVSASPVVVLWMDPHMASVAPGGTAKFTATVTGTSDMGVTWSVTEGSAGGSIGPDGTYTAPGAGGTFHVVATSHADSSRSDSATVTVQPFNTWYNVTGPVDVSGYSGAQFVLTDPARANDLYAFAAYASVYKSTDFGQTWKKWSQNDAGIRSGRPWACAIDPNPNRDPATPPVMYSAAGYGDSGLFKSTDGGVSWNQLLANMRLYCYAGPPEVYGMAIDPGNSQHILLGFRMAWCGTDTGLLESTDGGATWVEHKPPAGFGEGHYVAFVDSNTWLAVSIAFGPAGGTWRTTTAGRVNGVPDPAAWTKVADIYHNHGDRKSVV